MSIRMDRDNYEFLHEITKEERSDLYPRLSGTWSLAEESCLPWRDTRRGEASLGRAAELAGIPLGKMMMTILTEFGVESRLEREDYLQGRQNLQKIW
jgi:hypothetical protein